MVLLTNLFLQIYKTFYMITVTELRAHADSKYSSVFLIHSIIFIVVNGFAIILKINYACRS